jgi:O-antigen/teichoic acid export membrane protein
MFDAIIRLIKHSAIYGLGSLFQSLVGFILIPIYTRYLAPASYGRLEILNTILIILTMVLSLGFASAIMKVYERDAKTEEEKKEALGTMFLFVIPLASIFALLASFFVKFLANIILDEQRYELYLYIILATNLLAVFLTLAFATLRVQEKSKTFAIFSFCKFIFVLILNLYFVIKLQWGIFGILLGNLLAQILIAVFFIPVIIPAIKFYFSKPLFKKLMIFGNAIIPSSLAMWVMDLSDRYFLKHFSTMSEVGLYSLGYKIGMLVSLLLVIPFQLAWPTVSFSVAAKNNAKEIYAKVFTYFFLAAGGFALFLSVFAKVIVKIFASPLYYSAYTVIPFIAFSYVFYGLHFILVPGLHLKEKSKYYPLVVVIPAFVNLILNYIVVPRYGMMGAAMTTFLSFFLMVILAYFITQKFYQIKYEWSRLAMMCIALVFALVFSYFYKSEVLWQMILYNSLILFAFPVILYFLGFFEKKEIEKLRETLGRLKWKV